MGQGASLFPPAPPSAAMATHRPDPELHRPDERDGYAGGEAVGPGPGAGTGQRSWHARVGIALLLLVVVGGAIAVAVGSDPDAGTTDPDAGLATGQAAGAGHETGKPAPTARPRPQLAVDTMPETTTTLPLPDPPPRDPFAPTPNIPIGTLRIPKLNVSVALAEGITLTVVDRGAGHWPGTPLPGDLGNMVVAGHRTLYQKPFARLDELAPGDKVIFDTVDGKRFTYAVRGTIIVPANNIGVASQHHAHTATLFACHPRGQATHRIVVKLRLLDDAGKPVDTDGELPPMDVGNRGTDSTLVVRKYPDDPTVNENAPLAGADR